MSKSYVSVQIVAKETTTFGMKLFRACLRSIATAKYANQIIVVDNGCSNDVSSMIEAELNAVPAGVNTSHLRRPELTSFSDLRNVALNATDPETAFIHWIDTDEIYFPEKLTELSNHLGEHNESFVVLNLHHFMVVPNLVQAVYPKDVIYRYNLKMRWGKGVHEKIQDPCFGPQRSYNMPYLHFGYCRSQWRTALKWLHYDVI